MKFSESWLREWTAPEVNTEALAHQITMAGLEVDEVEAVAGVFSGVLVGEVVECAQHPDADKLRVTKVNVGAGHELLDIVCGASNCRLGLKVAVAMVGAVLPGDFKIKKAKLRGQPSLGMLCSFSELGINVDTNGIIEFPDDAVIGTDVREYLLLNDMIIDVDLTANRADCLSIRGIAREVGLINRIHVTEPEFQAVSSSIENDLVNIDVKAPQACPRYLVRRVRNVNMHVSSPLWMQEKLRRSGIRSIDPVVDVTNYVMLEQGQPMHAFDLSKIEGAVLVRMAVEGETLRLLDGNEATLNEKTLVIADQNKVLAIAGIFGGQDSGVSAQTTDILLESAFFAPNAIRGRARNYGLHTDSSHRFERGVDPSLQYHAMERATQLLIDICGGEAGSLVSYESEPDLPTQNVIRLRRLKLDSVLGYSIDSEEVLDILTRLGCEVESTGEGWTAKVPSWRFDMSIEEDLVEEVGRIFGYDNIPNQSPNASLFINANKEAHLPLKRVRDLLVDRGFHEAITYSFIEPKIQKMMVPNIEPLILPNPISSDMSAMRLSLLPGLLNTLAYNQKRQQTRVRLFEVGLRFIPEKTAENGISQEMMLAGLISGSCSDEHWDIPIKAVDFFDLKGDLEALLELTGQPGQYRFKQAAHPALHPGQSAEIELNGKAVGYIGTLHPQIERKYGLNGRAIVFEIEMNALNQRVIPEVELLSKFPLNRRDIAIIVDENISSDALVRACLATSNTLVCEAKLFDRYMGKGIEEGKKSLAISLTLRSNERTLEEADISEAVSDVLSLLSEKFGAHLRD